MHIFVRQHAVIPEREVMIIGKIMLISGLAVTLACYLLLVILCFRVKILHGLFSLFGTPIIVFSCSELRNEPAIKIVSTIWVISMIIAGMGLFIL